MMKTVGKIALSLALVVALVVIMVVVVALGRVIVDLVEEQQATGVLARGGRVGWRRTDIALNRQVELSPWEAA